jgi:DNA-directed RNA polymerase subunit RPC12/RpoP
MMYCKNCWEWVDPMEEPTREHDDDYTDTNQICPMCSSYRLLSEEEFQSEFSELYEDEDDSIKVL